MRNLTKIRSFALAVCSVAALALTAPAFAQHGGVAVARGGGYYGGYRGGYYGGYRGSTPGAGDGVASDWGFILRPCHIITRPIGTAAFLTTTRAIRTFCGILRWANIGP